MPLTQASLNLATWIDCTSAEGPGKRFALWVQGCPLRCPGCCNPEMFSEVAKYQMSILEVLEKILDAKKKHNIEGITCLGGEPFAQAGALVFLAKELQKHALSIMVFSGYTKEEIHKASSDDYEAFLETIDILVDGRYEKDLHVDDRRWIGSSNQRVYFLTERYQDDESWKKPNAIEISFDGKELQVTGFPKEQWVKTMTEWQKILEKRKK